MSFSVPTFNLTVNIWRNGLGPPLAPSVVSVANLCMGRRVQPAGGSGSAGFDCNMTLLLPPGTDIRDGIRSAAADLVEAPAGSLRFYSVDWVDDAGKGFPNEHRVAFILARGLWPAPYP